MTEITHELKLPGYVTKTDIHESSCSTFDPDKAARQANCICLGITFALTDTTPFAPPSRISVTQLPSSPLQTANREHRFSYMLTEAQPVNHKILPATTTQILNSLQIPRRFFDSNYVAVCSTKPEQTKQRFLRYYNQ
eukprot:GHVQ01017588.1.p2 GENE.GHVQ01017588.1~~GHVQ01017588.1.p2  ORF type:complete len:137 (-),score=13.00 GHVQ01017588.1:892-1302(-)